MIPTIDGLHSSHVGVQNKRTFEYVNDHRQLYTQLEQLQKESLKKENSGLNGIRTHDLCDTGAVVYQLSYQANWEFCEFVTDIPVEEMR